MIDLILISATGAAYGALHVVSLRRRSLGLIFAVAAVAALGIVFAAVAGSMLAASAWVVGLGIQMFRAVRLAGRNRQEPCGICAGYGCPDCREVIQ